MVAIRRDKAVTALQELGKEAWFLYSGLNFLATDGILNSTQLEIAANLGVSEKYVQRHLQTLEEVKFGSKPLIVTERTMEGYTYKIESLTLRKVTMVKKDSTVYPTNELFDYFRTKYQEQYKTPYLVANFGRDKSHVRNLIKRYDEDMPLLKEMVDVTMRLYDSRWKSQQFLRPTIGSFCSWIAAQAEPLARANMSAAAEKDVEITSLDGDDVFAAYDRKWGLQG